MAAFLQVNSHYGSDGGRDEISYSGSTCVLLLTKLGWQCQLDNAFYLTNRAFLVQGRSKVSIVGSSKFEYHEQGCQKIGFAYPHPEAICLKLNAAAMS